MGSSNTGGKNDSDNAGGSDSSNGGLPDPKSSLYSEGEKVLAYHVSRIYEAKVHLSLFLIWASALLILLFSLWFSEFCVFEYD